MTRYFRLLDDIDIPDRWHLGEVKRDGKPAVDLCDGHAVEGGDEYSIGISHAGKPLQFTLSSFGVPIVSARLGTKILEAGESDVQILPCLVDGVGGYGVLNATRLVACVDEDRSVFTKWTAQDHSGDLAGQYRMVTKLCLNLDRIPRSADIFRLSGWPGALMVSERLRDVMLRGGCYGAKFVEVDGSKISPVVQLRATRSNSSLN